MSHNVCFSRKRSFTGQFKTVRSAVTCPNLISTISTCRNCPNCRDRLRPIRPRRATSREFYPLRTHSSCLQTRNTVCRRRQRRLLDGPSPSAAQCVRRHCVCVNRFPNPGAKRLDDPHNAGNGIGTDLADRIEPTAAGALQQRHIARREYLAPPDTRSSNSESLPHETARRVFGRPCSQILV